MDLINYDYSSDENEQSPVREEEVEEEKKEDRNWSPAHHPDERNEEDMETDSLGLDMGSSPSVSRNATPQRIQESPVVLPKQDEEKRSCVVYDGLPPSPPGVCSEELKKRFVDLFILKDKGLNMNAQILNRKEFKNPAIYDKLKADFCVNEYGTNYSCSGKDNIPLHESDYYDKLAEEQSRIMEKEEQLKKTASLTAQPASLSIKSSSSKSRHSRFNKK